MQKTSRKTRQLMVGAAVLIVLAVALRIGGIILDCKICSVFGLARSAIYLFLIIAWAVLLARRIIQKQLRLYLLGIAGSMLLWFGLRTIKYFFVPFGADPALSRFLWYAYYIPMLTIPVQSLFAALALRKPEHYQPSGWIQLAWLVTAGLALLVLTNDFHQLVFSFSEPYPAWSDKSYSYEKLYWVVICWMAVCSAIALGIMICKCSIPQKKTFLWLPMIPMALMGIYGSLCVVMWELVKPFAGDITAVYCVLIGMTFESCIQCGLIQSNTRYAQLFEISTIAAQITDRNLHLIYASENAGDFDQESLAQAKEEPVILEEGIRLCAAQIFGGFVFWQEDISRLMDLIDELKGTREELRSYNGLLEEENKQKRRRRQLEEQKRLFEAVERPVRLHLDLLASYVQRLEQAQHDEEISQILGWMTIIGAYIKRRTNLVMLGEGVRMLPAEELCFCLQESLSNLQHNRISCGLQFQLNGVLPLELVETFFDFYEACVECSLETITDLVVLVGEDDQDWKLTLLLSGADDLSRLVQRFQSASICWQEGMSRCILKVSKKADTVDKGDLNDDQMVFKTDQPLVD